MPEIYHRITKATMADVRCRVRKCHLKAHIVTQTLEIVT